MKHQKPRRAKRLIRDIQQAIGGTVFEIRFVYGQGHTFPVPQSSPPLWIPPSSRTSSVLTWTTHQCPCLAVSWPLHFPWPSLNPLQPPRPPCRATSLTSMCMVFSELCKVMPLLTATQAHGHSLDLVMTSELSASEILASKSFVSAPLPLLFCHFHWLAFLALLWFH